MNMKVAEPRKRAAEPGVEKPSAGIQWVFECRPFEHIFIDLINQANHRTVCHMELFFTRTKIKTSYELFCVLMPAKDDMPKEFVERGRLFKREQNPACYKEFQTRNNSFSLRE